jgi:AraC-like DNA-binding protein
MARPLASGDGWAAYEVICTAGPKDKPFEEQHSDTSVAVVVNGTFQYRTVTGTELMSPGSLLLGNARDAFICTHEHGTGDRCLSFCYTEEFCDQLGIDGRNKLFKVPRIPAIRELSGLTADVAGLVTCRDEAVFEDVAIRILGAAAQVQHSVPRGTNAVDAGALARVTRVLREIESHFEAPQDLSHLAEIARLSPYHFLRTFRALTGTTPHQHLIRMRLSRAALLLRKRTGNILDIALDCGFADASNFSRAFRSEFGISPRAYMHSRDHPPFP